MVDDAALIGYLNVRYAVSTATETSTQIGELMELM
jgi:hypothetical protein